MVAHCEHLTQHTPTNRLAATIWCVIISLTLSASIPAMHAKISRVGKIQQPMGTDRTRRRCGWHGEAVGLASRATKRLIKQGDLASMVILQNKFRCPPVMSV